MMRFPTTHWTCIADAADPQSQARHAAVSELCGTYWYPIYSFIRSRGYPPDESADLTQEYFSRLLESRLLSSVDPAKGRFRALLWTDCRFFLADQRERRYARKRACERNWLPLNTEDAEGRFQREASDRMDPERLFDRAWALDVLARALERLKQSEIEAGRGFAFERLKPLLTSGSRGIRYKTIADELGLTEKAVESSLRRLRGRYRDALRAEVAATLREPTEVAVDEEIQALFTALSS
jgi:RNA polymerase sigma-70 factor (ECF subfamily)